MQTTLAIIGPRTFIFFNHDDSGEVQRSFKAGLTPILVWLFFSPFIHFKNDITGPFQTVLLQITRLCTVTVRLCPQ